MIKKILPLSGLLLVFSCAYYSYSDRPVVEPEVIAPDTIEIPREYWQLPRKISEKRLREIEEKMGAELGKLRMEVPENRREIARWIDYLTGRGKRKFVRALRKAYRYRDLVVGILEKEGLPRELYYLPIIESNYNPRARSRAGAVGIWQFMRGTARKYGLRVDWWMDERRDPVRSTEAAARYLKDLYIMFGRWDLALSAYNAGEGKVGRKVYQFNADDFWDVRRHLPRETRNYVPAFYAVLIIAEDPASFGIQIDTSGIEPFRFDTVTVPRQVDLVTAAKWAGVSYSTLVKYNPQFRRRVTPPYLKNFTLKIPPGTRSRFLTAMRSTPKSKWVTTLSHRVKRGETIYSIARKYGVRTADIIRMNNIRNPRRLRIGTRLLIPTVSPGPSKSRVASRRKPRVKGRKYHVVRRGDTLWDIARLYGVSVRDLKRWNNLRGNRIKPGDRLVVKPARSSKKSKARSKKKKSKKTSGKYITYRVRPGDTLYSIALRYGTSVRTLKRLNGIRSPRFLKPGQKLRIPKKAQS